MAKADTDDIEIASVRGAGNLTTESNYCGEVELDLSSTAMSVAFEIGDNNEDENVENLALLKLEKTPTDPRAERNFSLVFTAWFHSGALKFSVGSLNASFILDPPNDIAWDRCGKLRLSLSLPQNLEDDLPVKIRMTLTKVEVMKVNDEGMCEGTGKPLVWPRQAEKKDGLLVDLQNGYEKMDFPDFKIICQEREFKCHKFMLALWSPVFESYLTNDSKEAQEGIIVIEDANPSAVEAMLKYIYTEEISEWDPEKDSKAQNLSDLLQLAERYNIASLSSECIRRLMRCINKENVSDLLGLARTFSLESLRMKATRFIVDNASEIIKTESWNELLKHDTTVANEVIAKLASK